MAPLLEKNASQVLASEFHAHAQEFRIAAKRLSADSAQNKAVYTSQGEDAFLYRPTFYCVLHSIELGLKAFLALSGATKQKLASRAWGHNLEALVAEANKLGLIPFLDIHEQRMIANGSEKYSKKGFEYPEHFGSTYAIGLWLKLAKKLTANFQKALRTSSTAVKK